MATDKELQELEEASNVSAAAATAQLDASLTTVMNHLTRIKLLKPKTTDETTYSRLIALLQDATRKNESIANIRANVQKLGGNAVALLNDMAKLASKVV